MEDTNSNIEIREEKEGLWAWVKAHKKQLIIAGISITALVGLISGIKNRGGGWCIG